jgi:hypothetical protein
MTLFGNSLEAQLSRALFQQDIYRRMLDAYQERVSKEKFESKKSEEEFWSNYDKLVESISTTKTEIDNFYQKNDLYLFPKKEQAREALIKLENLRREFLEKYDGIPKGEQATGWAFFANKESRDIKDYLKEDFIPFALSYFKTINIHLSSLQPILFMHASMTEMRQGAVGTLSQRYLEVTRNTEFANLEFDHALWDQSWLNYKNSNEVLEKANTEIIDGWDPWAEKDIESILRKYEGVVNLTVNAANIFTKLLEKVEKKLEKIWEIRKRVEISNEINPTVEEELDVFAKIEKLARLLEQGAITQKEFSQKKAELLKKIN